MLFPLRAYRQALRDRIEDKAPGLTMPTLVVRGERDRIAPLPWAQRLAASIPDGRLAVIPGASHTVNYAAPAPLAELVASFASEVAA
jgi:pimeloyl-ACP methyl ester carboxylesterase